MFPDRLRAGESYSNLVGQILQTLWSINNGAARDKLKPAEACFRQTRQNQWYFQPFNLKTLEIPLIWSFLAKKPRRVSSCSLIYGPHGTVMPLAGGQGGLYPTWDLGVQSSLFQPRGADYAHHITACPPGFKNLTGSLRYVVGQTFVFAKYCWG